MPDVAAELQGFGVAKEDAALLAQHAETIELPVSSSEREALWRVGGKFGNAGKLWSVRPGNLLINWKVALLAIPGLAAAAVAGGPAVAVVLGLLAALVPLAQSCAVELNEQHAKVAAALWSDDTLGNGRAIGEADLARRLQMDEDQLAPILTDLAQLGIVSLTDGYVVRHDQLMLEG